MPKAHIRNGELTIPLSEEIREKLDVRDGDELEAHVFEGSLTVTRTTLEARRQAGERILATIDRIGLRRGKRPLSEEEIVEEVHAVRRTRRARPKHD
jgi:bifunctional DNA-binding transcriptional regulator/antitoxin component of YhaV-PrlF toxin-antitoxin module